MSRVSAALVVLSLAVFAAPAGAAEVKVVNGTVVYTAGPGEANSLTATLNPYQGDANNYGFAESGATITPGEGCAKNATYDTVECQMPGPSLVFVDLGDGNDIAYLESGGSLSGGPGNDKLTGGVEGAQTLDGGPGDDELEGDRGIYCNEGAQSPSAPDILIGGDGTDLVKYGANVPQFVVSIDNVPNDGVPGEGDDVRTDVENLDVDSCGATDVVTGSDGPNRIRASGTINGLGGDDDLKAEYGAATISGGDGNDRISGYPGNDVIDGGPGDDFLEGGFGDDRITGGPGTDSFVGDTTATNTIGTGNDLLFADDGVKENISCGPGGDTAEVDALDEVPVDTQNLCETVKRGPGAGGGTPPPGGGGTTPAAKPPVAISRLKVVSKGRKLQLRITCAATDVVGCNGTVRITGVPKGRKKATLATRTISLAPKKFKTYTLTIGKTGRSLVRRYKKLPITVTSKLRTSSGVRTTTQKLTLRR